jgi:STE24 endopeptidase
MKGQAMLALLQKAGFMVTFSPDVARLVDTIYPPARQALAYEIAAIGRPLYFIIAAFELVLLVWFWQSGAASRLAAACDRRIRLPFFSAAALTFLTLLGFSLALLPFAWFGGYVLPHRFGLSDASFSVWISDWAKDLALTTVIGAAIGAGFVRLVARREKAWPVIAGVVAAPLILFGNAIFPVFVTPLFNHYAPLPDSALSRSILAMAARNGISASVVYEYDMSRQTNEGNAYVAGIGSFERIAIGDTMLRDLKPDEVLYVVAHEMGHYKLHHLWWGSLYTWLGSLAIIALVAFILPLKLRHGPHGATELSDPAALPLLGAFLIALSIISAPVSNAISRGIEHAADVFAAEHTALGDAGVRAFARLGTENLSSLHPPALAVWYFYDHPPLDERIEYAVEHERSATQSETGP